MGNSKCLRGKIMNIHISPPIWENWSRSFWIPIQLSALILTNFFKSFRTYNSNRSKWFKKKMKDLKKIRVTLILTTGPIGNKSMINKKMQISKKNQMTIGAHSVMWSIMQFHRNHNRSHYQLSQAPLMNRKLLAKIWTIVRQ
jgi:hypothetical protein